MQEEIRISQLIAPAFYDLHEEFKQDAYREYWLKGGRGSTKSTFAGIEVMLGLLRDPLSNAVCFRRYSNELRDTVYGQMNWSIGKIGAEDYFVMGVNPMQILYKPTGQKIMFKGADNPHKLKSLNIGKGYVKYALFEEVDQYAGMSEIRNIIQSVFRGDDKNRTSLYIYNPPKSGRSWVNQEVKIPKDGRRVHHSDYRDVPAEWLGQSFIVEAEHLQRTNEIAYRHEYLGEEVGTGLEVFNNVTLEPIDASGFDNIRQGLDFGYAVDPACFVRMHYDSTRRRLYIFDEVSGIGLFNRELWDKVSHWNDTETIADSAEPKSIDELRSYGMKVKGAKKGPGSVEFGIKFLQDLEQIVIDPATCPRAAKEFINYALEMDRAGEVRSRFPDSDNHVIDCCRYALSEDMVERKLIPFNRNSLGL
jgi:PBSX family phage terminase large subunit